MSDDELCAAATDIGFPVLLKPSAGGGGKGMRMVEDPAAIRAAIGSARREARGAFGDDTLLVERFVAAPRHIEIQVLADAHGTVVHLGERECSLQRRHQKIIEEAPSVLLDDATRESMGKSAIEAARSCGYQGAGTIEFIVSGRRPDEFFFMEMNTRLQVEHPVTELVTGVDLVEQQLRIAAGEKLSLPDTTPVGHAVEARIYAEDPSSDFLPTGGTVLALHEPDSVRVDSGIATGTEISSDYDPMLAKYIAFGADRDRALATLRAALSGTAILGVGTNVGFLRRLLADRDVLAGNLDTELVERKLDTLARDEEPGQAGLPDHVVVAAVAERLLAMEPVHGTAGAWDTPGGWRVGKPAWSTWQLSVAGGAAVTVKARGRAAGAEVLIGGPGEGGEPEWPDQPVEMSAYGDGDTLVTRHAGLSRSYTYARSDGTVWFCRDGDTWCLSERSQLAAARTAASRTGGGELTSPMPGTVLATPVAEGEEVAAGAPVVVVEAMKMEHTVTSGVDGVVVKLHARPGESVALGQLLATVTPQAEREAGEAEIRQ